MTTNSKQNFPDYPENLINLGHKLIFLVESFTAAFQDLIVTVSISFLITEIVGSFLGYEIVPEIVSGRYDFSRIALSTSWLLITMFSFTHQYLIFTAGQRLNEKCKEMRRILKDCHLQLKR